MLNALVVASVLAFAIPPTPPNRISDQAGLLTPAETGNLEALFKDVEGSQGVHLGLLTVTDLDDDPKAVSVRTLNFWQMTPDSVLLLVSMNPRKVFLQPGTNLQYRLTESVSVGIIRDAIVPTLRSGRRGAAILNGFHAISRALPGPQVAPAPNTPNRERPVPTQATENTDKDWSWLLIIPALVLLGFLIRNLVARRRKAQDEARDAERAFRYQQKALRSDGGPAPSQGGPRASTVLTNVAPTGSTTVINNSSGGSTDLLTGVLIGNAISNNNSHAERVVERVVPRYEAPPEPVHHTHHESSYSSSDSSSGSGGGGSDFGSSGGGFDSSGGGGGGGSDW